jgi:sulfopyruvate decarboxylase TPP-binding subunit
MNHSTWPQEIYHVLKQARIGQVSYVPDAGHGQLIETTVLTTEEEGVALAAGAWLGGQRAVLLLQSSGVGNCINILSLMSACRRSAQSHEIGCGSATHQTSYFLDEVSC